VIIKFYSYFKTTATFFRFYLILRYHNIWRFKNGNGSVRPPAPGMCLSGDLRMIFSVEEPDCRASTHQKYIQSRRVLWFIMITLHSCGRMRSPDMITRMLRNTSNNACEQTEEMSYHNLILEPNFMLIPLQLPVL